MIESKLALSEMQAELTLLLEGASFKTTSDKEMTVNS
jgi:hypothetical protein